MWAYCCPSKGCASRSSTASSSNSSSAATAPRGSSSRRQSRSTDSSRKFRLGGRCFNKILLFPLRVLAAESSYKESLNKESCGWALEQKVQSNKKCFNYQKISLKKTLIWFSTSKKMSGGIWLTEASTGKSKRPNGLSSMEQGSLSVTKNYCVF